MKQNPDTKKIVFRVDNEKKRELRTILIQHGITIQDVFTVFTENIIAGKLPVAVVNRAKSLSRKTKREVYKRD